MSYVRLMESSDWHITLRYLPSSPLLAIIHFQLEEHDYQNSVFSYRHFAPNHW